MKIIADTNVWYEFGKDSNLLKKYESEKISPVFVNIYELSKTENIVDKEELTRNAIRSLFKFKENTIYDPPFVYLPKQYGKCEYDSTIHVSKWFEFTERFAQGDSIPDDRKEEFKKHSNKIRLDLKKGSESINEEAKKIRSNLKSKKEHRDKDTLMATMGFINFIVEQSTESKCSLDGYKLIKNELLIKVLDYFFTKLEISKMSFDPNDWMDFAILAYVQPGDKFWTFEKRWINLIKEAGLEEYLFKTE